MVAKRRQKKGKNQPLFAFCAVLPTGQEITQPAPKTLLTNGKIHIAHSSLRLRISAGIYMRAEIAAAFEKNIAFFLSKVP
ncbi:MAG: hypothetical protein MSF41_07375 [Oscillibacter sp.]|nr:hypothetical protein [Oscillibacter sp.]